MFFILIMMRFARFIIPQASSHPPRGLRPPTASVVGDKNESPVTSSHRKDLISNKAIFAVLLLSVVTLSACRDLVSQDASSLFLLSFQRSDIIGFVAGLGTTFASLPDLIAMLRRRSHASMNPRMPGIMAAFQILWIYYGWSIASQPVILWNVIAVLINSFSVGAYIHFARKEHKQRKKC